MYKIIEEILTLMKEVKSQKIKTSGLKTLLALGKRMNHDMALHLKLTNYAKKVQYFFYNYYLLSIIFILIIEY